MPASDCSITNSLANVANIGMSITKGTGGNCAKASSGSCPVCCRIFVAEVHIEDIF